MDLAPLILTLRFDAGSFEHFDAMRRRHFPPARNMIPAHLTLFHKLPGDRWPDIHSDLTEVARHTAPVPLTAESIPLPRLRLGLCAAFRGFEGAEARTRRALVRPPGTAGRRRFLPARDDPEQGARSGGEGALRRAEGSFVPFEAQGTGLLLWHYRGGPWEPAGEYTFDGSA